MKTEEGNNLIAEFMGVKHFTEFHGSICEIDSEEGSPWDYDPIAWLDYEKNWSLLMPVWYKFRDMKVPVESEEQYYQSYSQQLHRVSAAITHLSIKDAHEKLVEAIQWYNNYNKTKSQ